LKKAQCASIEVAIGDTHAFNFSNLSFQSLVKLRFELKAASSSCHDFEFTELNFTWGFYFNSGCDGTQYFGSKVAFPSRLTPTF
jgi:hypothetical protein